MSEVGVGAGVAIIVVVLRVGRRWECEGGGIVVEGEITDRSIELCC